MEKEEKNYFRDLALLLLVLMILLPPMMLLIAGGDFEKAYITLTALLYLFSLSAYLSYFSRSETCVFGLILLAILFLAIIIIALQGANGYWLLALMLGLALFTFFSTLLREIN